jgi:iron complex outermembrane recepter protein
MRATQISRSSIFASVALSALIATPAFAQVAAEGASDGDIVVTARRREENLLDVPVAITAYSAEALAQSGAIDITALSDTTPNVTLENSRGTNSTLTAFIRGVGQQDPVAGFEAGVGIYLDDVYLNRPQAAVLDIYDVERIEVLRGPQGTLYGRNTIGGAVKYVTKRLPEEFSLKVRATYGTYNQADGVATVSAPIGDMVRVGGSIARLSRGGFGDNLTIAGVENYNKDIWAGRGTFELGEKNGDFLIRISGDYSRDKSDPRNGHRLIPGLLSGAPVLGDVFDTRAGLNKPKQDVEAYGLAMNVTAALSDHVTLRSISAWREDSSFTPIDFDSLASVDVDVPALYRNEQVSQEFQLLYQDDKLNGLVGFYYLDAKSTTQFDVILGTTGTLLSLPGLNAYTEGDVRTSTWSVFGDFTYDFSDQFALSVGGRYTDDRRNSKILRQTKIGGASPLFGGTAVVIGGITDFAGRAKFTKFNPRASLSFKPSEDQLLYASFAQGFKGGGFDPRGDARIAPDTDRNGIRSYQEIYNFFLFAPETVNSYELGWKGSLAGGDLRYAVTGFYGDYKDVQIPGSVGVDANNDGIFESFAGVTTNAAKAVFKGVEAEVYGRFARDFAGSGSQMSFTGTLGYIDGQYKRYIVGGVDISNVRKIQNTPKWTLSGTYAIRAALAGGNVNASTTLSYRSKTNQFETPSSYLDQDGYALWDASITWSSEDDRWSFGVHGKNLGNKRYITSGYQFLATNTDGSIRLNGAGLPTPTLGREGIATAFYGNPRQVFATVGLKF